jgi:hypothetical protein
MSFPLDERREPRQVPLRVRQHFHPPVHSVCCLWPPSSALELRQRGHLHPTLLSTPYVAARLACGHSRTPSTTCSNILSTTKINYEGNSGLRSELEGNNHHTTLWTVVDHITNYFHYNLAFRPRLYVRCSVTHLQQRFPWLCPNLTTNPPIVCNPALLPHSCLLF